MKSSFGDSPRTRNPDSLHKEHDFMLVVLEQEAKVWLEIIKAA